MCVRVNQGGFSLTEVLVSILVLALGVIGAAGMQVTALRTSRQSFQQTAAIELATAMAGRIRSNEAATSLMAGENPFVGIDYSSSADPVPPQRICHGTAANCDPGEMASFDIYEWEQQLKAAVPSGRAVICRDAKPWDSAARSYKWGCDASSSPAAAPLVIKVGWQTERQDRNPGLDSDKHFSPALVLAVGKSLQ